MKTRYPFVVMLIAAVAVTGSHAEAIGKLVPSIPAADHAAIRNYRLDSDIVQRLVSVAMDVCKARIDRRAYLGRTGSNTLEDITNRVMDPQPRLAHIVESHGFTRREYMTATFALASARQALLQGGDKPSASQAYSEFVSPVNASEANIAFYKAHRAELDMLLSGQPLERQR